MVPENRLGAEFNEAAYCLKLNAIQLTNQYHPYEK